MKVYEAQNSKKKKIKKSKWTLLSKMMKLIFCPNQTEVNTFTAKF